MLNRLWDFALARKACGPALIYDAIGNDIMAFVRSYK